MEVISTPGSNVSQNHDTSVDQNHVPKAPTIEDFEFIKPISKGAFGKVFLGHKKGRPEQLYAIKAMKKSHMINKNLTHQVVTERDAMAQLLSPFIVQLFYSMQSQQNIFLVMEYLIGGDVKSLLSAVGFFDPEMALMYVAEVTLALQYLHSNKIIHRDIKPDNMLVTASGHLKLTDFGLSKCDMITFTKHEVPMTPKTPMPYSQKMDLYRTPGQVLSLKSSLAFSTGKSSRPDGSTQMSHDSHMSSPLADISNVCSDHRSSVPGTPAGAKLQKQKSMHDMLLSQSTTKYMNQNVSTRAGNVPATPGTPGTPKPPIKRLHSTLQATLNWTKSTDSHRDTNHEESEMSIPEVRGHAVMPFNDSTDIFRSDSIISDSSIDFAGSCDMADDVFNSFDVKSSNSRHNGHHHDNNSVGLSQHVCEQCHCHRPQSVNSECSECCSHLKAPSRQEKITDDTPQMHRSNESVWNSYAAQNLRSLRRGSYSEDNEETEDSLKENLSVSDLFHTESPHRPQLPVFQFTSGLKPKTMRARPRRLMKTKSFCYPSDDESDTEDRGRQIVSIGRKRAFSNVEQSPVRRTHSADSGLTQEIRLLGMEPCMKRSNSVPRTRIRFHSGKDSRTGEKSKLVSPQQNKLKDCTEKLSKLIHECKSILDMDKMLLLSADEHRLVEGHSDTSATSENESRGQSSKGQEVKGEGCISSSLVSSQSSGTHVSTISFNEINQNLVKSTGDSQISPEVNNPVLGTIGSPMQGITMSPMQDSNQSSLHCNSKSPMQGTDNSPIQKTSESPVQGTIQSQMQGTSPMQVTNGNHVQDTSNCQVQNTITSPMQGTSESLVHDINKSPMQGTSENSVQEISESLVQGTSDNPVQGISKSPMQGNSEHSVQGISMNLMQGTSENSVQGISENLMQGTSENSVQGISDISLPSTSLKLPENDTVVTGAREMFPVIDRRIMGLKKQMVSSLNSECGVEVQMKPNLSSIYASEDCEEASCSYDLDSSVFIKPSDDSDTGHFRSPSPPAVQAAPSTPLPPPPPLLPPPLPKSRHQSGKRTPARLRFCPTTTKNVSQDSPDLSSRMDVCATPKQTARNMVKFYTPGVKGPMTPKTPLHKMMVRSQSFCHPIKTPYRTPKLYRRAPVNEEERILGTPDYLAPEILKQKPHGPAVDWWALGVCLFEFLTGVPPFNDQTPDLVFQNILQRDIPWPEGDEALTDDCRGAIEALLTEDPQTRPGARAVCKMPAFKDIDWHNILDMEPPFVPAPDSLTDTTYFEARNMMQGLFVSDVDLT